MQGVVRMAMRLVLVLVLVLSLALGAAPCEPGPAPTSVTDTHALLERALTIFHARTLRLRGELDVAGADGRVLKLELVFLHKADTLSHTQKRLFAIVAPPELRGTGVLVLQGSGGANEVWLASSDADAPRRLGEGELLDSLLGSGIAFADLLDPSAEGFCPEPFRRDRWQAEELLVVDVRPCDPARTAGYGRIAIWLRADSLLAERIEYFDAAGTLLKTAALDDPVAIDRAGEAKLPFHLVLTDARTGRRSELTIHEALVGLELQDDLFTPAHLARGGH